ncbi:MAG: bactofilin [Alicyclobacillus macrosporangiidus]|uniref:bactofilin n=1 Tax=Alicyclobacillus macrosporangiidus TaxID=392015 RepID=UPI0026F1043A|nr:bactofilin [Alicyclobacillus macrosporangiidus]MCL6598721.1 bactofilin [Alicyclobacillus macrosporangiidus]
MDRRDRTSHEDGVRRDLTITGEGSLAGGTYGRVRIRGEGELHGDVDCEALRVLGNCRAEGRVEARVMDVTGTLDVAGGARGGRVLGRGVITVQEACEWDLVRYRGVLTVHGGCRADRLDVRGMLTVEGDLTAEACVVRGVITVDGLVNAETLELVLFGPSRASEIGGGTVNVRPNRVPFAGDGELVVDVVEGDEVSLHRTIAKVVRGGRVTIGRGCRVDLVEYREAYEADPRAEVGEVRKV